MVWGEHGGAQGLEDSLPWALGRPKFQFHLITLLVTLSEALGLSEPQFNTYLLTLLYW